MGGAGPDHGSAVPWSIDAQIAASAASPQSLIKNLSRRPPVVCCAGTGRRALRAHANAFDGVALDLGWQGASGFRLLN